jgi:hypothetical protein
MKADFAWVWGTEARRAVIGFRAISDLPGILGNGRLEVLRDGFRFAIMGRDGAGHRDGEGRAGGGDDGSDLHGLSPSAYRLVFVLHCFLPALPAC